jgi:hypothetical protein
VIRCGFRKSWVSQMAQDGVFTNRIAGVAGHIRDCCSTIHSITQYPFARSGKSAIVCRLHVVPAAMCPYNMTTPPHSERSHTSTAVHRSVSSRSTDHTCDILRPSDSTASVCYFGLGRRRAYDGSVTSFHVRRTAKADSAGPEPCIARDPR